MVENVLETVPVYTDEELEEFRGMFKFDYSKVRRKFHASDSAEDELVLYKGIKHRAPREKGIFSNAIKTKRLDHLWEIKEIIENGTEENLNDLIDRHTTYYWYTPLLSATFNPEMAQVYASKSRFTKNDSTIYKIRIKANRCIVDPFDFSNSGKSREFLILGMIFPEEIKAEKIRNDATHSELYVSERSIIRLYPDSESTTRVVIDPSNWM